MFSKIKFAQNSENNYKAYCLPFLVFMLFLLLPDLPLIKFEHSSSPWWRRYPEHWIYPAQSVICFAIIIFYWRNYNFKPIRFTITATLLAILGISIWVLPATLASNFGIGEDMPSFWQKLFGLVPRNDGFNPEVFANNPFMHITTILFRFFRMVIVVPFVEEIFWRGFLMRYLINDSNFSKVPFGKYSHLSFWLTTLLFTFAHARQDWLAALIFGLLMGFLTIRFKSLYACIVMHAVANLLLGIFILKTKMWGFW